ncbi:Uncharacterised protein [Vibrio cholerae]|nr:Uncharacterised protein [Vibrio cholerae]
MNGAIRRRCRRRRAIECCMGNLKEGIVDQSGFSRT